MTSKSGRKTSTSQTTVDQELCLLGVTRLPDFIEFVRKKAVDGRDIDEGTLVDMWRKAAGVFAGLQVSEAGIADKPEVKPLSRKLQAHVDKLTRLPHFQACFPAVPVSFGMVELDKLIVSQQHITQSSVQKMTRSLKTPLSETALAELCLPLTPDPSAFGVALEENGRYVFSSDTHDARFLGAKLVKPADIKGHTVGGHVQAVLALSVGFTTNVLNVVRFGPRMVLNNGYHRAIALRKLGITHAPCLIQVCGHWEEVGLAGSQEVYHNATVYFTASRPPLLRDYANPALTRAFNTVRTRKQITLTYEVDTAQLGL
ncbi:MAG: hypothetical protein V4451_01820 [Pseudomonadota bacterium]